MKGYFIKLAAVRLIGQVWVGELNQSTLLDVTPNNVYFLLSKLYWPQALLQICIMALAHQAVKGR